MSGVTHASFVPFDQVPPQDASHVLGAKGHVLNRMTRTGHSVPPGFTITAPVCNLLRSTPAKSWPADFLAALKSQVTRLEELSGRRLGDHHAPLLLALRSGAAVSMPGAMQTILGVGSFPQDDGSDDPSCRVAWSYLRHHTSALAEPPDWMINPQDKAWEQLLWGISVVIQSWDSPHAQAFRQHHSDEAYDGTAVNVQLFVPVRIAGVIFTQHPQPSRAGEMLIEYSDSLTSVVAGHQTPFSLNVHRPMEQRDEGLAVVDNDTRTAVGQALPDVALQRLVHVACQLEGASFWTHEEQDAIDSSGLDIEWGWNGSDLVLFQARPVVIAKHHAKQLAEIASATAGVRNVWVRHNLSESLRHPTPLTWSIVERMMSADGALGRVYRRLGYRPPASVSAPLLRRIGSQIYADPGVARQLFDCGIPWTYDLDELCREPERITRAPTRFDPDACGPWFLLQLPIALWRTGRAARRARPSVDSVRSCQDQTLRRFTEWRRSQAQLDLTSCSPLELQSQLRQRIDQLLDNLSADTLAWGVFAATALAEYEQRLRHVMDDDQLASRWAAESIQACGRWPVTPALAAVWTRRGWWDRSRFVQHFAHRGPAEWELSAHVFRDPEVLQHYLDQFDHTRGSRPADIGDHDTPDALRSIEEDAFGRLWLRPSMTCDQMMDQLTEECRAARSLLVRRRLLTALKRATALTPGRELGRDVWLQGYDMVRQITEALARVGPLAAGKPPGLYFLSQEEIISINEPRKLEASLEVGSQRRRHWEQVAQFEMPDVIDTRTGVRLITPSASQRRSKSHGQPLVDGIVEGTVIHIASLRAGRHDANVINQHSILVCRSLDVADLNLFLKAGGIVTEQGGILSHTAIVARQLGIPIVRLADAIQSLPEGKQVAINGQTGRVSLVTPQ